LKDLIENPPVLQTKPWDKQLMYPPYTFESGPRLQFSRQFHFMVDKILSISRIFSQKCQNSFNIPETNRTLETFLIHKKPSQAILTRMEPRQI
jgi:hypothetical protein